MPETTRNTLTRILHFNILTQALAPSSLMLENQSQYQCQQWEQQFVRNQRRRSSKGRRRSKAVISGCQGLSRDDKLVISSKVTYLVRKGSLLSDLDMTESVNPLLRSQPQLMFSNSRSFSQAEVALCRSSVDGKSIQRNLSVQNI